MKRAKAKAGDYIKYNSNYYKVLNVTNQARSRGAWYAKPLNVMLYCERVVKRVSGDAVSFVADGRYKKPIRININSSYEVVA